MVAARLNLILVRHGLTDWNVDGRLLGRCDIGLNVDGRVQAEDAARALESFGVGTVLSSPQIRARETAEPIARRHRVSVGLERALDEVWVTSEWQGRTVSELRGNADLEKLIVDPTHRCESIEPVSEVQARTVKLVERLRDSDEDSTIVAVSHGDPLRLLLAHYLGLPLADFRRLAVDNGSVSLMRFSPRGGRLLALNWRPSLGGYLPEPRR